MEPKESKSSSHFDLSIVKSGLRICGCFSLSNSNFIEAAIFFGIAEFFGILEEII